MSAVIQKRRSKTAREIAEHFGCSVRTVQNHFAEPRTQYVSRAAQRRQTAGKMMAAGSPWGDIAKAVGGSEWAARGLVRRYESEQKQKQTTGQSQHAA